jgi:hypothetical protein
MQNRPMLFCIATFILVSCGKTNTLSKKDFKWMPYIGNETLVFNSTSGDTDTFFFLKKDTILAYPEAQAGNGIKYEVVSIFCKHSDPWPPDGKHQYLENSFLNLQKATDNYAELNILLSGKDAVFYRLKGPKIDTLNNQKPLTFQTKYGKYDDVYVINADDNNKYSNRSDFVTKVYWSKSKGLIRYDKKDSIHWELKSSY